MTVKDVGSGGLVLPAGQLAVAPMRARPYDLVDRATIKRLTDPQYADTVEVADWRSDNRKRVCRDHKRIAWADRLEIPTMFGALFVSRVDAAGLRTDFGLASLRVVTNAGVAFMVDAFQNLVELEILKFHGIGTGGAAEAVGDTTLAAEITANLNPDNTRGTGTLAEAAANIFQTVATNTVDGAVAVVEHGLFSQAATGGGTLFDRSVFAAVNLAIGDSIQTDYRLTLTAGG